MSRGGRREGSSGAGVPVKGETGDIESGSSVILEAMERGGIAGGRPLPSLSLCTRLILLDELALDLPADDSESRGVAYRAGLRRDCWISRPKAFVGTTSPSNSGSSSGSGRDERAGRRGNGGFRLGRGVGAGRSSSLESDSKGSSKGVDCIAGGCTGRGGRGGGTGLVDLIEWSAFKWRSRKTIALTSRYLVSHQRHSYHQNSALHCWFDLDEDRVREVGVSPQDVAWWTVLGFCSRADYLVQG